jgi:hypothetical protein
MLTVHLHVGAMKSGTSYLQRVLQRNRAVLRDRGVLLPGRNWGDQVEGAEELVDRRPKGKPGQAGAWQRLVDELAEFSGHSAIISMEALSFADDAAVQRAIDSLHPHRVRVIITARDLRRVVPAQWQEAMQNGFTISYERFLQVVSKTRAHRILGNETLWAAQDFGYMLRTWRPAVAAPDDLVLVTVPPSGSAPSLLWERFCAASELDPSGVDATSTTNESLGSTSAELMRRINQVARKAEAPYTTRQALKHRLAKGALISHRHEEPSLVLPQRYLSWAARSADWQISEIKAVGPRVIGDLDDLAVASDQPTPRRGTRTVETPTADEGELLDSAMAGLIAMADQVQRVRGRRRRPSASEVRSEPGEDDG